MRKIFLALLFVGCGVTDPSPPVLEAGYTVETADSLNDRVTFWAVAPDSIYWKLEWIDHKMLFDYGQAVHDVRVPVVYARGFKFWFDFRVWNHTDTILVTYMSPDVPPGDSE